MLGDWDVPNQHESVSIPAQANAPTSRAEVDIDSDIVAAIMGDLRHHPPHPST